MNTYIDIDYEKMEMEGFEKFHGKKRNYKKEAAKRKERDRRAAAKFEANMECLDRFGMTIKEKRKADRHRNR